MTAEQILCFWDKVYKTTSCWHWTGCKRDGYGLFRAKRVGSMTNAHRVAWQLLNGPIPRGLQVLHRCDVRDCVNPSHLFLGTLQDNMKDRNAKGRQARGDRSGRATISYVNALAVKNLRPAGRSPRGYAARIARQFKVDEQVITNIWRGRAWRHL